MGSAVVVQSRANGVGRTRFGTLGNPLGVDVRGTVTADAFATALAKAKSAALFVPKFGNVFQDSAGTTPAVADDPVGLMLSAEHTLGPELVVNGGFDSDTVWVKGTGWTISGGQAVATAAPGAAYLRQVDVVVAGKFYRVEFTCASISAGTFAILTTGGDNVFGTLTAPGKYVGYVKSTNTGSLYIWPFTTLTATIDNISVREVIGYTASVATAGLRPTLRHGDVNRLTYSDTLSTQNVTTSAIPYTLHFTGTGTVTLSGTSTAGPLVGTGVSDRVSLTFTPTAGTLTLTVSGSVTAAMLNIGSTAAPYVTTTAVPKSNGVGPLWLETDGVDDYLLTKFATPASGHIFMGGWQFSSTAALRAWAGSGNAVKIGASLGINTPGYPRLETHNGTTPAVAEITSPAYTPGTPCVLEGEWTPTSQVVRYNGSTEASNTGAVDPATAAQILIGARNSGTWPTVTPADYLAGGLSSIILVPTALNAAEASIFRRYAASLAGVTL